MAPCEKKEVVIIAALFLATYVLVIMILGGRVSGEFILILDPTGPFQRWVNASILYRERMVPVFIISVYYSVLVMAITILTISWENLRERVAAGPKNELWRYVIASILIIGVGILYLRMGRSSPVDSSHELSRVFERPTFANKYSFVLMLVMLTLFSSSSAQIISALYVKIKLLLAKDKQHDE